MNSDHHHNHGAAQARQLKLTLAVIISFMALEVTVGLLSGSLALLSDAAHMLTDAAALAMALVAAQLATRPARGALTFGLGRAEILSANANGLTLLVLALLIVYGAIRHLIAPVHVDAGPVLAVALAGMVANLVAVRVLGGPAHTHQHEHGQAHRSLNVEGSYQHILTDLFGFAATAAAALVILLTGAYRADAIASLLIAAVMLFAAQRLIRASVRVMMEAAPEGVSPAEIGVAMAAHPGVVEIHDLHVWEVTTGFNAISAHVIVDPAQDCHETRRALAALLRDRFGLTHSTLQVEHAQTNQGPLQIELTRHAG
ncbi:cation diffusion facilitator family transporter [Conexibacter sp. S30A1]|uniref:cation diffusion facilitator family transporter n=1 Tax=Conexibacter sp. S30A1 TaxID=2937800 RepID=UPI00200EE3CE|nr:cation diffusion facilitator family transporter [Conexibacter sp. S30A1]